VCQRISVGDFANFIQFFVSEREREEEEERESG
jgi:hypothetical protein